MLTTENQGAVALESLKIQADMIALESMNPSQVLKALPHKLPAFVADVKSFIGGMLASRDVVVPGAIDTRQLERDIPKSNYVALSEITVYVPPSMDTDWMTYLDAIDASQSIVEKLVTETLAPTLRWISIVLSNPQQLASQRSVMANTGIIFHDIEKAKKSIAKCYARAGSDTKVTYGDVFKRNTDALVAMKRMNDLNERMSKIDRTEVVNLVNEITDAFDKLLIRMQQYPEEYRMSGITMKDLSTLAFNLGHEIEFFSAHVYMVQSAAQAMDDTAKKINDVLKL